MDEQPRRQLQFGLKAIFIATTLIAVVVAILAWIEPHRQAPLVGVIGSTILIIGFSLALIRAVRNLFTTKPKGPEIPK